jgi:hypothetical protein
MFPLEHYVWLGSPAAFDLLLYGADLLVTGGTTFRARKKGHSAWVYVLTHLHHVKTGRFDSTRLTLGGRLFCRIEGCAITYVKGFEKIWSPTTKPCLETE